MDASPTVKRYNLAPPNEQDLLASLDRLLGMDASRQAWATACRQAGLRANGTFSLEQFDSALQQLKLAKGLASVAASSLLVRVRSYRTLATLNK